MPTIEYTGEIGNASDGYHTFNELYEHRIVLWVALCRQIAGDPRIQYEPEVWRSKLHSDGSCFEGWFVLGMGKRVGHQMTYHLPMAWWHNTEFAETLDRAPEFDGHTPSDVLRHIISLK